MRTVRADTRPLARDQVTIACPECGGPASIEWSAVLPEEAGPEHLEITCVEPHDVPSGRAAVSATVG
jgi:hypothetical protein